MSNKLTHLQKAGALIPMAILVGAWGIAVGNSGLATALSGTSAKIPEVPAMAMEQPAYVQRVAIGINPQAGAPGAISTLSTNGIPSAALYAYHRAETLLAGADGACRLPWNLVAAIGRVESNHGRAQGSALNANGLATPAIFGTTKKTVQDSDSGKFDRNSGNDVPVGPMGLLPEVLNTTLVDADSDGTIDPQDIDDSATATGVFLCSGIGDLSTEDGARAAVQRFNSDKDYVDLVLRISASYANGAYSQTPDGYSTATILTSQAYDQTLSEDERDEAREEQKKDDEEKEEAEKRAEEARERAEEARRKAIEDARNKPKPKPTKGAPSNGGDNSDSDSGGGGGSGDPIKDVTEDLTDTVGDVTEDLSDTVKDVTDTVDDVVKGVTGG